MVASPAAVGQDEAQGPGSDPMSEKQEKYWADIAERREREQQNYGRSQKSTGSDLANPRCYVDVSVKEVPLGRLVVELFSDVTPLAAENFRSLCTGERGYTRDGVKLDFIGSSFHLVHPSSRRGGGCVIGGDITDHVGSGGASVFGVPFPDEGFKHRHTGPGLLSMDSQGPNNNTSRFRITTAKCPHLDYCNVVFGRVTDGLLVVERLDQVMLNPNSSPKEPVTITFCGQQNKTIPYEPEDMESWQSLHVVNCGKDGTEAPPEDDASGTRRDEDGRHSPTSQGGKFDHTDSDEAPEDIDDRGSQA